MVKKAVFLISDSLGTLVDTLWKSIAVQFPDIDFDVHIASFTRNFDRLQKILDQAKEEDAIILSSFAQYEFSRYTKKFAKKNNLFYKDAMVDTIDAIRKQTGERPLEKSGLGHSLDEDYFNKIRALEFSVVNDDGQHPEHFKEADIVLLGVSRTSKTPLSIYLAFQGYKVANLPIVPEASIPDEIFRVSKNKMIGLTTDANVLDKYRRERLLAYGLNPKGHYSDARRIETELQFADDLFKKLNVPVINTANRSIEESASVILVLLGLRK